MLLIVPNVVDADRWGIIYLVKNRVNGKGYVGQTVKAADERWSEHVWDAARGKRNVLHRAIRKYGAENFSLQILEAMPANFLNEREQHWVAHHNTHGNGYNETEGGAATRGWHHSEKTKCKIAEAQKGKYIPPESRERMRQAHLGKRPNLASVLKRSASMKGKHAGEKNPRALITQEIADAIRESDARGVDLARLYGVSPALVSSIRCGRSWVN